MKPANQPLPPHFEKALEEFRLKSMPKLAYKTRQSYRTWIVKYLRFLDTPTARSIDVSERKFEVFLSAMADPRLEAYSKVSQEQAFYAVLFLYKHVFGKELQGVDALRARKKSRERYCPTETEVFAMLRQLRNTPTYNIRLLVGLLAGCGLRVSEGCQLRIKDVDLARGTITVFEGKGDKDRQVTIPEILLPSLTKQIARATALAEIDIAERQPVQLPGRLAVSRPAWQFQARWHFLFPSPSPCAHPDTGKIVRWCIGPSIIQRAVKDAAERAGVEGKVTPHCLRHFFISELLDSGQSIKRVAEAAGHTDIRTTAGYARKDCLGIKSPLDNILRFQKSA